MMLWWDVVGCVGVWYVVCMESNVCGRQGVWETGCVPLCVFVCVLMCVCM